MGGLLRERTDLRHPRNQIHGPSIRQRGMLLVVLVFLLGVACGKVGPPIYPEDIGLAVKLEERRSNKASELERAEGGFPQSQEEPNGDRTEIPQEGDVLLPPLRPLGSQ